jgi:hypothetical protein
MGTPTVDEVKAILPSVGATSDVTINAFISAAGLLVGRCPVVATYEDELQTEIKKWVAAHLLSIGHTGRAGPVTQKALGDASESYASPALVGGKGLQATLYGQMAISLDPSGCLEKIGKLKATFSVL